MCDGCQIVAFSIDFDHRFYNTLVLPCECMIYNENFCHHALSVVHNFFTNIESHLSVKPLLSYNNVTVIKMTTVRHLGFFKNSNF